MIRSSTTTTLMFLLVVVIAVVVSSSNNHSVMFFVEATTNTDKHHTSLDEPFQSAFHSLKHSPCVTLYNRQGRVGCSTADRDSSQGPIYYYDDSSSSSSSSSSQQPQSDHVAVIEEYQLTSSVVNTLVTNGNGYLKGIMVLNGTQADDTNTYASPGPIYPLGYGTPSESISYGNTAFAWNPKGDGLIQTDLFGVPLVYINEYETSSYIRKAAQDQSKASTIYAGFNYYMGPDDTTSIECLSWMDANDGKWNPKCLPLGGLSVWAHAGSPPPSNNGNNNNQNNQKNTVVFGTSIDSTSLFHDLVPGANEGATNTLTLLMAAYLFGKSVSDATLDSLSGNRVVFGFFAGEAYGYLGSRSFINDVLNFQCDEQYTVNSVAKSEKSDLACLYPMRPSLKFQELGTITGVVTVDQVGLPAGDGNLYVHNSGQGDGIGSFLASVMKYSGTSTFTASASSAGNNANEYPYPPTAVTSLLSITGGYSGGAVLTGYDMSFNKRPPYQSHLNWVQNQDMNLNSIASAATILARTAYAAAYDDGSYDYETASYNAKNVIGELSADDEMLVALADCLLVDGNCKLLNKYAAMDAANERARTGFEIEVGESLGTPPNYYVDVYSSNHGQPLVKVGSNFYGAYNGKEYGKKDKHDAIFMQPKMFQQALRNLLHTFLGRNSMVDANGNTASITKCSSSSDCSSVSYCSSSDTDSAVCSADKICVCRRAHFHLALDEALTPSPNNMTGYFDFVESDAGNSPVWAEPFWSSNVGVNMYRHSGSNPGWYVFAAGGAVLGISFFVSILVKVGMKKEKLF